MTFDKALGRELEGFPETVAPESHHTILRAGRLETAAAGKMRRDGKLVEADQEQCRPAGDGRFFYDFFSHVLIPACA